MIKSQLRWLFLEHSSVDIYRCGRRSPGYICDQHNYLKGDLAKLDEMVKKIEQGEGMVLPCAKQPEVKGYAVGIALGNTDSYFSC